MKKLTLNQAWTLCLRQWKWIIEQLGGTETEKDITVPKEEWMRKSKYKYKSIKSDCFFCEYSQQQTGSCFECPGALVSKRFRCWNRSYDYNKKPRKFYAKLLKLYAKYLDALNEKRKAKK